MEKAVEIPQSQIVQQHVEVPQAAHRPTVQQPESSKSSR